MELSSPLLLYIETGGTICSVALSAGNTLLALKESTDGREHARLLSVFIDELLRQQGLQYCDIDAVVISKGPGSYTGLRIGTATAKGICFGTNKPLIAVDSLLSLTQLYLKQNKAIPNALCCPMIDARRMEVYTALFDTKAQRISDTHALIVDEGSFVDVLDKQPVIFFGDGADKCKDIIHHPNAVFANVAASASGMIDEGVKAFADKRFEDTAYFEPFYLKDFVVTESKKKIL